jgi:hypothetical protein
LGLTCPTFIDHPHVASFARTAAIIAGAFCGAEGLARRCETQKQQIDAIGEKTHVIRQRPASQIGASATVRPEAGLWERRNPANLAIIG